ncbi:magnesium transporter [Methanosalsum zhilinae]|nr:magnesium transporter [Methanosalsum zhilinae]
MDEDYDTIHANLVKDVMDEIYFAVNEENTIEDTISQFRHYRPEAEETTIYYVYVTDNDGHLIGVMSLRDLLNARGDIPVSRVMKTSIITLKEDEDVEIAAREMSDLPYRALPVVNWDDRLVGVVRSEEMLDVVEEEASEDIFKSAGMVFSDAEVSRSYAILESSAFDILRIRLPWLMFALAGGLIAGVVIEGYEATLGTVIALAFFLPVIMDMGGNVGTQASTIFVRGLAVGHIDDKNAIRHFISEGKVGLMIGLVVGIIGGLVAYLWQGMIELAIVIFLTLLSVCLLASIIGFIIPWIVNKVGYDPAAVSDPMITTVKDVTALIIYFGLAALFIPALI